MRSVVAASLVVTAAADYQCPGGTWLTHAGLRMTSTAAADCDTVKAEMRARVAGENGWYDQHNRGTYTEQNYGGDLSYSRLTGDGKYTDKMIFVFTDQNGSCKIEGCSEAQVFSIADFSTNYCEQKLLYCGSDEGCNVAHNDFTHSEDEKKTMAGASTNFKNCLKVEEVEAPITAEVTGTLGITYEDCGAKHAHVDDLQPASIRTGRTEVITGTGTSDEDVTSANFKATVSALGAKLSECSGDGTKDIVCHLPMGVGKITVKALDFPLPAGTVSIPVEVKTSKLIPASLAHVDVHIEATEQNDESIICLDVHTSKAVRSSGAVRSRGVCGNVMDDPRATFEDFCDACGDCSRETGVDATDCESVIYAHSLAGEFCHSTSSGVVV